MAAAAAILVFVIVVVSGSWPPVARWLLIGVTGLIAVGAALMASRGNSRESAAGVEVGNRIRSRGNVAIEDVSVDETKDNVRVGNDIVSRLGAQLRRIAVGRGSGPRK